MDPEFPLPYLQEHVPAPYLIHIVITLIPFNIILPSSPKRSFLFKFYDNFYHHT